MRYCIARNRISRETLRECRIRHTLETISDFQEDGGDTVPVYVIWPSGMKKLMEFGYVVIPTVNLAHDADGTLTLAYAVLQNRDGSPASPEVDPQTVINVTFERYNGRSEYQTILPQLVREILAPVIRKNVCISVPHGQRCELPQPRDDVFNIYIWSSPIIGESRTVPETMWGNHVSCQDMGDRLGLWQVGSPILTPEGDEVGACNSGNLYIYHDAVEKFDESTQNILRELLQETAAVLMGSGRTLDLAAVKQQYITACARRTERELAAARKEVIEQRENIDRYQAELRRSIESHDIARHLLDHTDTYHLNITERLSIEFDAMLRVEHVMAVGWRGNNLIVTTDDLYCVDPRSGHEHHVGCVQIMVDQDTCQVLIHNLTHQIHGYENNMQAPHVFHTGRPCFGSLSETVSTLMASYEWSALIQICIAFLESVNVDDAAGSKVHTWPVSRTADQLKDNAPRHGQPETAVA